MEPTDQATVPEAPEAIDANDPDALTARVIELERLVVLGSIGTVATKSDVMNAITNRHQRELTLVVGPTEALAVAYAIVGSLFANIVGNDPKRVADLIEQYAANYAAGLRARPTITGDARN